ncbi:MAG: hypothetical protein IPO81_09570 [Kouleothrix sp.]|nr:hypothetical protein [Kouleothrix sp.]
MLGRVQKLPALRRHTKRAVRICRHEAGREERLRCRGSELFPGGEVGERVEIFRIDAGRCPQPREIRGLLLRSRGLSGGLFAIAARRKLAVVRARETTTDRLACFRAPVQPLFELAVFYT